jgi:hypothetical protein
MIERTSGDFSAIENAAGGNDAALDRKLAHVPTRD